MTPEGRVKQQVTKWLKEHDIYYFMPVQTGYGRPALDYICCWRGLYVEIECKAGDNDLTARQRAIYVAVERAGGLAFVVRSYMSIPDRMELIDAIVRRHAKFVGL